jgi:RecB family exonuclease
MADFEPIQELSPTLVASIRRCGLAVYFGRLGSRLGGTAVSNPPARLGAAVHRVLAWVAEGGLSGVEQSDIEFAIRRRWTDELASEQRAAAASAVESYFGPVKSWPGFTTAEERLVIEASWLAAEVGGESNLRPWAEREYKASNPPMRGTPDLVLADGDRAMVVEYKSGSVKPEDARPTGRYGLQVLLYAWMVAESGLEVTTCEIRPVGRPRFAVEVNNDSIREARETAAETLRAFNVGVGSGDVRTIANPNDHSCGYCPHVLHCPAIWDGKGMLELEEMQVIEGTVGKIQETHLGTMAVEVERVTGTRTGAVIMNGLDPRRLAALQSLRRGDQIRVSGLRPARTGNALVVRPGSWVQVLQISGHSERTG